MHISNDRVTGGVSQSHRGRYSYAVNKYIVRCCCCNERAFLLLLASYVTESVDVNTYRYEFDYICRSVNYVSKHGDATTTVKYLTVAKSKFRIVY